MIAGRPRAVMCDHNVTNDSFPNGTVQPDVTNTKFARQKLIEKGKMKTSNWTPVLLFGIISVICMFYPASSGEPVDDYDDDYDADDVRENHEEDDAITKRSIPDDDDTGMDSLDRFEKEDASAMGRRRRVYGGGGGRGGGRRRWWKKK